MENRCDSTAAKLLLLLFGAGMLAAPGRLAAARVNWEGKTDWRPVEYMPLGDVIYFDGVPYSGNPEIKARFEAATRLVEARDYGRAIMELEFAYAHAAGSQAAALQNIMAFLWQDNGDGQAALKMYHASYETALKAGDATGQGAALSELGFIYETGVEDYDSALYYLRRARTVNEDAGLFEAVAYDEDLISEIFKDWGQTDSALPHQRAVFYASVAVGKYADAVNAETDLGSLYLQKADTSMAMASYLMSWGLLPKTEGKVSRESVLDKLRPLLQQMGRDAFVAECRARAYGQEADALVAELGGSAVAPQPSQPEPSPVTQPAYYPPLSSYGSPAESRFGVFAVGLSLGRAGGLFAGYASVQPFDFLGVEFDYGVQPAVTSAAGPVVTLWPSLLSAKLQAYGGKRSRSTQLGFEVAADQTEEAGWGAHGALLLRLRSYPMNIDLSLGAGRFFDYQSATKDYVVLLMEKLGYIPTDLKLGFVGSMPNYLVGGMGFSISF